MTATRLEDLPNELWLELFVYFTSLELSSTWLDWSLNSRIQMLAQMAQSRVALEISTMSLKTWSQLLYYFEHEHQSIAHRITSIVFDEAVMSSEITRRWLDNGSFLPRIRRCMIFVDFVGKHVLSNLIQLIHQNMSILRHLVIFFDRAGLYERILEQLIKRCISLHTMELIIVNGNMKDQSSTNTVFLLTSCFKLKEVFETLKLDSFMIISIV